MRTISLFFILLFCGYAAFTQVTNTKEGNWSDPAVWSSNLIPNAEDEVELNFNIVVDIDASCSLLYSNGHQVTVNSGAHLIITGSSADTLLSKYGLLHWTGGAIPDTFFIIYFSYDSLKRNTMVRSRYFNDDGTLRLEYDADFFYKDSSRQPYKKILTTPVADDPYYVVNDTHYFTFGGEHLLVDSVPLQTATYFSYLPDSIISINGSYRQAAKVEYLNGNIVRQLGPSAYISPSDHVFEYDDHPNPFFHTQYKLLFSYSFPFYSDETFIEEIFAKNNALSIYESGYDIYSANYTYDYKHNGYPAKAFDGSGPTAYYSYWYTH